MHREIHFIFFQQVLCDKLRYIDGFDFRLRTYLQQRFEICEKIRKIPTHPDDTPYTTVVHRDLWSNNIMVSKGFKIDS